MNKEISNNHVKLESARKLMLEIFEAQKKLRELHVEYSWKGLGNTLGDYGELIAISQYGMTKAGKGSKGHDALHEGKRVQVKAVMHSKQIGIRGNENEIDMFLVLRINESDASWTELFFGTYEQFTSYGSTPSTRDNKTLTSVTKLQKIKK